MNTIAVNGSPRKNWNTATLLENALKGAAFAGSKTEFIHLYNLNFKGCVSCFKCKIKGGKYYGDCAVKDGLTKVLKKIKKADALIIGSPVYMGSVSGSMKSFMERLLFQYFLYTNPYQTSFKGKLNLGFICNMGMPQALYESLPLKAHIEGIETTIQRTFGNVETLHSFDTYQMDDYTNIDYSMDIGKKQERRKTEFPKDCEKAFEMGKKLISENKR